MKTLKLIIFASLVVLGACKKDKNEPSPSSSNPAASPYYVRMTDAPGPYRAVYIDLQSVEITGNGSTVVLNTHPGIYNLLDFTNGKDTLIATGSLTLNKVEQIRLILGANNSIVTSDSVSHPLSTPSAQQSGLKLLVNQSLSAGVAYNVELDFDAAKSIVDEGNGSYSLKPVIRTIEKALSGAIKGKISHPGVFATVTATSGSNSYSAFVNSAGEFIIPGLPPGTYSLTVSPAAPYSTATVNPVVVVTGATTDVGTIQI